MFKEYTGNESDLMSNLKSDDHENKIVNGGHVDGAELHVNIKRRRGISVNKMPLDNIEYGKMQKI